jgi:alpha-galactosidase
MVSPYILENEHFQLKLDTELFTFSLYSPKYKYLQIDNSFLGLRYKIGFSSKSSQSLWEGSHLGPVQEIDSPHGPMQQCTLHIRTDHNGLDTAITFALPHEHPLLLWRMRIDNHGKRPIHMQRLEMFRTGFIYAVGSARKTRKQTRGSISLHSERGDIVFYSNGWQSWSYSGTYDIWNRSRNTRLGFLRKVVTSNPDTPAHKGMGLFSSDMFAVYGDRIHRNGILLGFLAQQQHFGSLEAIIEPVHAALRMWANGDGARLDPGTFMVTDWACLQYVEMDTPDPLGPYMEAVARQHGINDAYPSQEQPVPVGWCSWYEHLENISADIIIENLQTAQQVHPNLPLDIIQIDDGFQVSTGDWLTANNKFPNGLTPLASEIKNKGFQPGLWLAPFIVSRSSQLFKEHPDWILRNRIGRISNAGFLPQWGFGLTCGLDLTNPDALHYIRKVLSTAAHVWGFSYIKLDFLYAAALKGQYKDSTKTRAQVLRTSLQTIREAVGDQVTLVGCGCPLGPAIGLIDVMRVGADVAQEWFPSFNGIHFFLKQEPDIPAVSLAIHNTITRAFFHRRWWINDPDCLILGQDLRLTLDEIHTLATIIALSGGSIMLSDDLPNLPPERLRIAQKLLPPIGKQPRVLDLFDKSSPAYLRLDLDSPSGPYHLLAVINWKDKPQPFKLYPSEFNLERDQQYIAREFWSGRVMRTEGDCFTFDNIPAHGVIMLALRTDQDRPQYLGSDLHISQGLEVSTWQVAHERLVVGLTTVSERDGVIDLALPSAPRHVTLNDHPLEWKMVSDSIYRFPVELKGQDKLLILF